MRRPLDGEHDCLLGLPGGPGSIEEDRELGAPGLPRVAESGLSGKDVLKLGGASREKPGISEGFHGLGFTVGEAPRDGTGFLEVAAAEVFATEEDGLLLGTDMLGAPDGVEGRRVGVADLEAGLGGGMVGLEVGVEDLAVDLDGVDDLEGTVGLVAETEGLVDEPAGLVVDSEGLAEGTPDLLEDSVGLEVGVEDLDGLEEVARVDRLAGLAGLDLEPPADEGLRTPATEEFNPGDEAGCPDIRVLAVTGSAWEFAN